MNTQEQEILKRQAKAKEVIELITLSNFSGVNYLRLCELLAELGLSSKTPMNILIDQLTAIFKEVPK